MGKKLKFVPTGREFGPNDGFDWTIYDNGYEGGNSLYVNKSVKTHGTDKVFCHEPYAQELYDTIEAYFDGRLLAPKDSKSGTVYSVDDIGRVSDHEIRIDSNNGMTSVIDLNKETPFIKSIGLSSVKQFIDALETNEAFKKQLLNADLFAKVVDKNRVSIWEGYRAKIEAGFMEDLVRKEGPKFGYDAKVLELNNGGYTVDIMGVHCFLPSSLAASGPITDFEELVGKNVMVCVVNYSANTRNFVVSHKKYLEVTLASRVAEELYVGKPVFIKVTGISKNGLFCAIKDKTGEFSFASLMHRSTMSPDAEGSFDRHEYIIGDQFRAFVHKIIWTQDNQCRIVIGDTEPVPEKKELTPDPQTAK